MFHFRFRRIGRFVLGAAAITTFITAVMPGRSLLAASPAPRAGRPPLVALQTVARAKTPVGFALHPNGSMYVVEQAGLLRPLGGQGLGSAVLDVTREVSNGGEQGLLNAVFSNDGGWLYVDLTNRDGATEIRAYPFVNGAAETDAMVLLLTVEQPYSNHNGGALVVDSSGALWIGMGDGGSAGDPGNRAQNLSTHLGKLLRILPTPGAARPYDIPAGNLDGAKGKPEIWGYGLRNPWRIAIDGPSNMLWIADVGQGEREEINAVSMSRALPNFGWRLREGRAAFKGGAKPAGAVDPVYEYRHSTGGCSVTGGVMYNGSAVASWKGSYLFSDYCDGKIRVARRNAATGTVAVAMSGLVLNATSGFGVDARGEVYVASTDGAIAKIVPR